jgi:hypothetical protein
LANSSRSPRPGLDLDMFSAIRYRRNPSAHRSGSLDRPEFLGDCDLWESWDS